MVILCQFVIQPASHPIGIEELAEIILDFKEVRLPQEGKTYFCLNFGVLSLGDVLELDGIFEGMVIPQGHLTGGTVKLLLDGVINACVDGGSSVGDVELHSVLTTSKPATH
jgi:hypothetical protein